MTKQARVDCVVACHEELRGPRVREAQSASARTLIRHLVAERIDAAPTDVTIARGARGEPSIPCAPDLNISISHTLGVVAVAVADRPIGIDVQYATGDPIRLVQRVFSDEEIVMHEDLAAQHDPELFRRSWTAKEAIGKALGRGLRPPFAEIDPTRARGRALGSDWF